VRRIIITLILVQLAQATPKDIVRGYSERYGVDSLLVYAVIATESSWDPSAINSGSGCVGLMQINPPFHGRHPVAYYLDAENNIRLGVKYLSWLLDNFEGDLAKALTGYCYGPYSRAAKAGGSSYSAKVLRRFKALDKKRKMWVNVNINCWNTRHIAKTDKRVFSFEGVK